MILDSFLPHQSGLHKRWENTIVVDFDGNGQYDVGVDALDDSEIEVTAGFFGALEVFRSKTKSKA